MNRSTLDKLISTTGLVIGFVLLTASAVLFYTHKFVHSQVYNQLSAQKIMFPAAGTKGLTALPAPDQAIISKYAGQPLTDGIQAEAFADHYIAVHLKAIGAGKTYSELSADALANPSDTVLAKKVQTVFQGESLRGMLLNAYAFDTMALVAWYVAWGALGTGILLLLLALLGFRHAGTVKKK